MDTNPSLAASPKPPKTFYHRAATISAWLVLPPFIINYVTGPIFQAMEATPLMVVIRLVSAFLIIACLLIGVTLGIIALCGISKYGRRGILVKALIGVLVPLIAILIAVPSVIQNRHEVHEIKAELKSPPGS